MIKDIWPFAAIVIILAGLAAQNAALALLGLAIGVACGGATLLSKWSRRRLHYQRQVPEPRAFPGDEIPVTLRITNRKPLPLWWIEVHDSMPAPQAGEASQPSAVASFSRLTTSWSAAAAPYERISHRYTFQAPGRGIYELGPATIKTGDPFGLFPEQRIGHEISRILVYPRLIDMGDQPMPARRPFGESAGGLRIFEDPLRVAGLRDYQPGDPLRRIDWKATARSGRLQSRVYEPSSSQHLLVCLNTATLTPAWAGVIPELFEGAITIAASVARWAHEQRYSVGLIATSSVENAPRAIRVPPGREHDQLVRVLEALAVVTSYVLDALAAMLDREEHRMAPGTTLAVVTATMPEELLLTLGRLRRRGHPIVVLSPSGNRWQAELEGIEVRTIDTAVAPAAPFAPAPAEVSP
jgi:uncharacterized protein (DUF58 family)